MDLLLAKFGIIDTKLDVNIATVWEQKSEVQQLKEGNSDMLQSVNNLEERFDELIEDMNSLKQKMKNVKTVNNSIENRVKELENIAETELVRTECLVNKYLDRKDIERINSRE